MASYTATLVWNRGDAVFTDGKFSRAHDISFDGGVTVPASASPHIVRAPLSREDAVDPEEMLVASLSSCHLLTFVHMAYRAGFVIDSYVDRAEGVMTKNDAGKLWVSKVTLRPEIVWGGETQPTAAQIHDLHHHAHQECFIANSYRGEVVIDG
jgi:organic hydroperoxide reductase OsmC/OhrA